MNSKSISAFLVAGILSTTTLGIWVSVSAQVEKSQKVVPPKFSRIQDPGEFKLQSDLKPFLPSSLRQTENPGGGSRAIIGRDNRIPMTSREYPWSAVGQLEGITADGSGYACTGTLIAEDVVLTNAHCFFDPDTQQLSQAMVFYPNLINGIIRDENDIAYVTQAYAGTDFSNGGYVDDWAFLKLNKPLGRKYGYLGLKALPSSTLIRNKGKFALVGYSGDFPNPKVYRELTAGPSMTAGVHKGCSILREVKQFLFHNCDSTSGASGGPIISRINGEFYIVALHSGWNPIDGKVLNRAVEVSRLEKALRGN